MADEYSIANRLEENADNYTHSSNARAINDFTSGLKQLHMHALQSFFMNDKGDMVKSAKWVADIMGSLHPHGDASIYDALVLASNEWKTKVPYVEMQGNFGCFDGDKAAANRYTEMRLSPTFRMFKKYMCFEKPITMPIKNFNNLDEWTCFVFPYHPVLMNGTTGIGLGVKSDIPPLNMKNIMELYRLCSIYVKDCFKSKKHKKLSLEDLTYYEDNGVADGFNIDYLLTKTSKNLLFPDFAVHVRIDEYDSLNALLNGKGTFKMKSSYFINKDKDGYVTSFIIYGAVPYSNGEDIRAGIIEFMRNNSEVFDLEECIEMHIAQANEYAWQFNYNNKKNADISVNHARKIIDRIKGFNGTYSVNYNLTDTVYDDEGEPITKIVETNPLQVVFYSFIDNVLVYEYEQKHKYRKFEREYKINSIIYNNISLNSPIGGDSDNSILSFIIDEILRNSKFDKSRKYEELKKLIHDPDEKYVDIVCRYLNDLPMSRLSSINAEDILKNILRLDEEMKKIKVIISNPINIINMLMKNKYANLNSALNKINKESVISRRKSFIEEITPPKKKKGEEKKKFEPNLLVDHIDPTGVFDVVCSPLREAPMTQEVIDENKKFTLFITDDNKTILVEGHRSINNIITNLNSTVIEKVRITHSVKTHLGSDIYLFSRLKMYKLSMNIDFIHNNLVMMSGKINMKSFKNLFTNDVHIESKEKVIDYLSNDKYPLDILLFRTNQTAYIRTITNTKKIGKHGAKLFTAQADIYLKAMIPFDEDDDKILFSTTNNKKALFYKSALPTKADASLSGNKILNGNYNINNIITIPKGKGIFELGCDIDKMKKYKKLPKTPR